MLLSYFSPQRALRWNNDYLGLWRGRSFYFSPFSIPSSAWWRTIWTAIGQGASWAMLRWLAQWPYWLGGFPRSPSMRQALINGFISFWHSAIYCFFQWSVLWEKSWNLPSERNGTSRGSGKKREGKNDGQLLIVDYLGSSIRYYSPAQSTRFTPLI